MIWLEIVAAVVLYLVGAGATFGVARERFMRDVSKPYEEDDANVNARATAALWLFVMVAIAVLWVVRAVTLTAARAAVRIEHAPQRRSERARRARDERASRIAELERETGISDVTDPDQGNTKRGCAMSDVGALALPEWFYRFAPLSIDALKGPVEQYRAGARDMLLVLRERPWLLDGGRAEFEKKAAQ